VIDKSRHGGYRPGAGRKWEGHVKYERVSFVAPPDLKEAMDQAADDLRLPMAEVWRLAAKLWLETNDVDI